MADHQTFSIIFSSYNFNFVKCWVLRLDQVSVLIVNNCHKWYISHSKLLFNQEMKFKYSECSMEQTSKCRNHSLNSYGAYLSRLFPVIIFLLWFDIVEKLKSIIWDITLTLWREFCWTRVFRCWLRITDGRLFLRHIQDSYPQCTKKNNKKNSTVMFGYKWIIHPMLC